MPENPIDQRLAVKYSPELALRICEEIASGLTITDIAAMDGMPTRQTIYRWIAVYPKFYDAFERAREVSAQSLEEEALLMARTLKDANNFTGTKVQAYNIAMQQLRWSASRRDKARYGQQQVGTTMVPIQINTTLNLSQEGQPRPTDTAKSVYTVEAMVQSIPAFTSGYEEDSVEELEDKRTTLEVEDHADDNERLAFGLPEEEKQQLHNPPMGRRKKGHKPPGEALKTARAYAAKEAKRLAAKEGK